MAESDRGPAGYTAYHSQFLAHRLTLAGLGQDAFARSLSAAKVEMKPHQVDAALFALQSPLAKGAILADEVGLGKTIEAGLVIAQRWAERRRRILLIVPASLRKQWSQELRTKFSIPSVILDAKIVKDMKRQDKAVKPFDRTDAVVIVSYEYADKQIDTVGTIGWNLVVIDEAHRLRNVHRKAGSARAKRLKQAIGGENGPFRVLLTATPLQNSLMELYGLVSIVDEHVFGDEDAFKANYTGSSAGSSGLLMLRDRLRPVMRRTLRKSVLEAGHIAYTKRNLVLETYEPVDNEAKLYNGVSAFLKRGDTVLFGDRNNPLVLMGYQKILGSSTYAIAQTLDSSIRTLKRRHRASLEDVEDIETEDERTEERDEEEIDEEVEVDPLKLQAEIVELTVLRDLALSIGPNAKGDALVAALPRILDQIEAKQGARKAVIFTESVRTQRYLRDLLAARGFQGQIALLNGSNTDAESRAIYEAWKKKHEGSADALSGSRTADMKAAIVDAFRDHKTILIATESGAEGINLQFCSLVINFDLPWNPQRVEQRIGRCHRFGQKIDVTVVNLLNLKNRAEERIHELLNTKFRLFEGVFGVSDQVLGVIGDGIDFEARVLAIVSKSRTDDEVKAEFDKLQTELDESIKADMAAARQTAIDHLDASVVKKLKDRDGEIKGVLDDFDRALITLARAELPEARFHSDEERRFDFQGRTWTTEWPIADDNGWQFFTLTDGNLASELAERAKRRRLSTGHVAFKYSAHQGVLADVRDLRGQSGWLRLSVISAMANGKQTERLVLGGITDAGEPVAEDTLKRLWLLSGQAIEGSIGSAPHLLDDEHRRCIERHVSEMQTQVSGWFDEEEQKLSRYAQDLEKALEVEVQDLDLLIEEQQKQLRSPALALADKIAIKRQVQKLDDRRDELLSQKFSRKKEIRNQVNALLDQAVDSLRFEPNTRDLFTLRWDVLG
jgi:ERCC4-related helicase